MEDKFKEKVTIENLKEKFISEVLQLQSVCKLSHWSEIDYKNEIERKGSFSLVAGYKDRLVGFAILRVTAGEAEIYNIAVDPDYRNRGIGKMLLREAINKAVQTEKIERIWLEVRESNRDAIRFYQGNGFFVVGRRKNFYAQPNEDALLMVLQIV
jgi:[ribosomal protein S18]-alanine N-acetyltransferase